MPPEARSLRIDTIEQVAPEPDWENGSTQEQ